MTCRHDISEIEFSRNYVVGTLFGSANSINTILTMALSFISFPKELEGTALGFCGGFDNYSIVTSRGRCRSTSLFRSTESQEWERWGWEDVEDRKMQQERMNSRENWPRIIGRVIFAFLSYSRTHARALLLDYRLEVRAFIPLCLEIVSIPFGLSMFPCVSWTRSGLSQFLSKWILFKFQVDII